MKTLAHLILGALLVFPAVASAQDQQDVDLARSFRIPQDKKQGISHTPAVVFTKDGAHMLTATSTGQVVVFDAKTLRVERKRELPGAGTNGISIDATGRYVAWVPEKGGVAVMEIESGKIVARDPKLAARWVAISPDARWIALAHGANLEVRELTTLAHVGAPVATEGAVTNLAWSPNGKLLGWTTERGRVVVREPDTGRGVYAVKKATAMHAIAFSPDSAFVAYGGNDKQVHRVALPGGSEDLIAGGQPFWITCLGFSPDGKLIAAGDESCDIWLFDVAKKKRVFHNKHHVECWLNSVAWAPDNETFVFGCRPNSHAGQPHLHLPLAFAEAARSTAARESRVRLLALIDDEIAKTKDANGKALLTSYRAQVAGEEQLQQRSAAFGFVSGEAEFESGATIESLGAGAGGKAAAPAMPKNLPEDLRKRAEEHRRTIQAEMTKLRSDFCVNQWKVKRPTDATGR